MKKFLVLLTVISALSSSVLFGSGAYGAFPAAISGLDLMTNQTKQINLNAQAPIVVIFLSIKCPSTQSHLALLNDLSKKWKQFQFVGIHSNADEDIITSQKYFQDLKLNFPVIQDEKNALADVLKAFKTPQVYILKHNYDVKHNTSKKNDVEILYSGGITESYFYKPDENDTGKNGTDKKRNYLLEALEDLDQNRPLRTSKTRSIGCAIARE